MRRQAWRIGRSGLSVVVLFVPAAVLGGAGMIYLRAEGFHVGYAVGLGCGVIALYAILSMLLKPKALPSGLIGDNCYYLGFIFTLMSLAWTLYALSESTGEDRIVEVVSGFGIALLTTLAGLIARVALNPPRVDLADEEQLTRVSLAREAALLQKELIQTTAAHKQFGAIVRQSLDEFSRKFDSDLRVEAEARLKAFEDQMRRNEKAIAEQMEAFGDTALEAFDKAMQKQLKRRLEAYGAADKAVSDALDGTAGKMSEAAARLDEATNALKAKTDALTASVGKIGGSAGTAVGKLNAAVEEAAGELDRTSRRLAAIRRELADIEADHTKRSWWGMRFGSGEGEA